MKFFRIKKKEMLKEMFNDLLKHYEIFNYAC